MIFSNYPYTNFHEMNLDWILAKMRELDQEMDDFTAFNTIVWAGSWDANKTYLKWSIVSDSSGNGWISLQAVPVNVPLTDGAYWQKVADFDALYAGFNDRITELELGAFYVTPEMYGAAGDGVSDDTDAIQEAVDSDKPVYMGGTYKTTQPITIASKKVIRCDGKIIYSGTASAIVVSYSLCDIFINELETNGNGIEMLPVPGSTMTHCQHDIIKCNRILMTGENGIGLYLNSSNGMTQFCKFIINRLQGGSQIGTNIGVKIVGLSNSDKYCNANIFDIHSICFFDTGILTDTVANSCISNYFIDINFEQNTVAVDISNARYFMSACFDEPSSGKFKINNGVICTVQLNGYMAASKLDFVASDTYTSRYDIFGWILSSGGVNVTDNLHINNRGWVSHNAATPFTEALLSHVFSEKIIKYITNGDTIDLPAVRKGGNGGYMLQFYDLCYSVTSGTSGSVTLSFSDGTTQTVNYTAAKGIISVVPNQANNGELVIVR